MHVQLNFNGFFGIFLVGIFFFIIIIIFDFIEFSQHSNFMSNFYAFQIKTISSDLC